jgi:hypothetical protein
MALGQLWARIEPYGEPGFGPLTTSGESGGGARVVPTGMLEGVGVSPTLTMLDQWMDPKVVVTLEGTGMFSQVKPLVFEVA